MPGKTGGDAREKGKIIRQVLMEINGETTKFQGR